MSTTTNKYAQPALIGGLVFGVLSALPSVSFGNFCCCMWGIGGGVVAAYLLQSNQELPVAPGDGALVGILAGLAGAGIQFILSIPIDLVIGPWEQRFGQRLLEMTNNPQMQDMLRNGLEDAARGGVAAVIARRFLVLVLMLFVGTAFSTIGGVLGALMFKKAPPPPQP